MTFSSSTATISTPIYLLMKTGFPGGSVVNKPPANARDVGDTGHPRSLGWAGSLEEEMATHSSILAWRIPWTEEPGGLQSMRQKKSQTQLSTQAHFSDVHSN